MKTEYVIAEASQIVNAKRAKLRKMKETGVGYIPKDTDLDIQTIDNEWKLITYATVFPLSDIVTGEKVGELRELHAILSNESSCTTFKGSTNINSAKWLWRHSNGRYYTQNGERD